MKHIKRLSRKKKYVAIIGLASLALVCALAFSATAVASDNSNIGATITANLASNLADNTNALPVTHDGTVSVAPADNEAASMKTANTTAPDTITTGIAGDAYGGHVIAFKNDGATIILAISEANYDTKTTIEPILC